MPYVGCGLAVVDPLVDALLGSFFHQCYDGRPGATVNSNQSPLYCKSNIINDVSKNRTRGEGHHCVFTFESRVFTCQSELG